VLGKGNKNANAIVAMVLGFLVVGVVNYTNIINDIARLFGLLVVMAIAFALIYGLFGKDISLIKKRDKSGTSKSGKADSSSSSKPKATSNGDFDRFERKPGAPPFRES
jgi:hypothetical protein